MFVCSGASSEIRHTPIRQRRNRARSLLIFIVVFVFWFFCLFHSDLKNYQKRLISQLTKLFPIKSTGKLPIAAFNVINILLLFYGARSPAPFFSCRRRFHTARFRHSISARIHCEVGHDAINRLLGHWDEFGSYEPFHTLAVQIPRSPTIQANRVVFIQVNPNSL